MNIAEWEVKCKVGIKVVSIDHEIVTEADETGVKRVCLHVNPRATLRILCIIETRPASEWMKG